jgi:hypothetical protein
MCTLSLHVTVSLSDVIAPARIIPQDAPEHQGAGPPPFGIVSCLTTKR